MKKSILALGLSLASVMLFAESLGEQNFKQKNSIPANIASSFTWGKGVLKCSLPVRPEGVKFIKQGVRTILPNTLAGKKVEFSADVRWIDAEVKGTPQKGYIQFAMYKNDGNADWNGMDPSPSQKEWTTLKKTFRVPADLKTFVMVIGFENACGNFEVRNIEYKVID